jgi:hypothetical protein
LAKPGQAIHGLSGRAKEKLYVSFAPSFENELSKDGGISIYRNRNVKNSGQSALLVIPRI